MGYRLLGLPFGGAQPAKIRLTSGLGAQTGTSRVLPLAAAGKPEVAGEEGFEPSNAGIKIRCLNQLGDSPTAQL
ncbi:hypothetical protein THIARS_60433 [Thiomonas delicata]|uniref:Uncharacterized protein n=1 Tax=Thiomonas delicata TaxID=364030 RepID=A0A238D3E8_THIDL|nr:hypothetical protein THIARS_60433 [Thiomonas delicata]